ncbi:MAG: thioredoxin, partial [Longimicrobiales bacterium]
GLSEPPTPPTMRRSSSTPIWTLAALWVTLGGSLHAQVPVLVDFYADWCAPCKMVAPLLDEIAHQKIGKILVTKVDTDHAPDIAMKYEIRSIPTLIMFQEGEEIERSLGFEPERVRGLVEKVVA